MYSSFYSHFFQGNVKSEVSDSVKFTVVGFKRTNLYSVLKRYAKNYNKIS